MATRTRIGGEGIEGSIRRRVVERCEDGRQVEIDKRVRDGNAGLVDQLQAEGGIGIRDALNGVE